MSGRMGLVIAVVVLAAAGFIVYSNTFEVPFLFDDVTAIPDNPSVHSLWPPGPVLFPEARTGLERRPLVHVTYAINYAFNELRVEGYHAVNLAIHILAALTLFGIVRRTLMTAGLREKLGDHATPLALAAGLIWLVHPLQTESVTYIFERGESLMGLFFFLTLYCAIRGADSSGRGWLIAAVVFCLLGTTTKERAVVAPVMVLLYDRAFIWGSFREALRRRWKLYLGLGSSWALLGVMMLACPKSVAIGFGLGVTPMEYTRIQVLTVVNYLVLCFRPYPLILDYGHPPPPSLAEMLPYLCVLGVLLVATVIAAVRWPRWGFLGAWVFLILAPSSSFIPEGNPIEEHHMYLPLAGVVMLVVVAVYLAGTWALRRLAAQARTRILVGSIVGVALLAACTIVLGVMSYDRNKDYATAETIWADTIKKCPENARAYLNMGKALSDEGRLNDAIPYFHETIRRGARLAEPYNDIGVFHMRAGRLDEAIEWLTTAITVDPKFSTAHANLGTALLRKGHLSEAVDCFRRAIELGTVDLSAYNNFGVALILLKRYDDAIPVLQKAVELAPKDPMAYGNLGRALYEVGRFAESIPCFEKTVHDSAQLLLYLADAYAQTGRFADASALVRKVMEMMTAAGKGADAEQLRDRLKAYEAGRAMRIQTNP